VSAGWALASLSLSMLLASLGTSIANVGLPTLAQAFNASFQQVQWIVIAYLLAITSLIVSVGRLGDIIGRKRLLLTGIFLFTLASALCGLPTSHRLTLASAVKFAARRENWFWAMNASSWCFICFENAFPQSKSRATGPAGSGAQWLSNGQSSGLQP
jgi:MFS family permease